MGGREREEGGGRREGRRVVWVEVDWEEGEGERGGGGGGGGGSDS